MDFGVRYFVSVKLRRMKTQLPTRAAHLNPL